MNTDLIDTSALKWITQDKEEVSISEMRTNHIYNCLPYYILDGLHEINRRIQEYEQDNECFYLEEIN